MVENRRILVIDDDPGVRGAYKDILAQTATSGIVEQGAALFGEAPDSPPSCTPRFYDLTLSDSAESGITAVEQSVKNGLPYAAAFIDMSMPKINGAEAAGRIWAIDPDIKVVIVTAFSELAPCEIIRILGREDVFYLKKPFYSEEIRQFAAALTIFWSAERENKALAAGQKTRAASPGVSAAAAEALARSAQSVCDNLLRLKEWGESLVGSATPPDTALAADEMIRLADQTLRDARDILKTLRRKDFQSPIEAPGSASKASGSESE